MTAFIIRIRTPNGVAWLDEDRWSADRARATRYQTREAAEHMARWFLFELRGRSPELLGWSIENVNERRV